MTLLLDYVLRNLVDNSYLKLMIGKHVVGEDKDKKFINFLRKGLCFEPLPTESMAISETESKRSFQYVLDGLCEMISELGSHALGGHGPESQMGSHSKNDETSLRIKILDFECLLDPGLLRKMLLELIVGLVSSIHKFRGSMKKYQLETRKNQPHRILHNTYHDLIKIIASSENAHVRYYVLNLLYDKTLACYHKSESDLLEEGRAAHKATEKLRKISALQNHHTKMPDMIPAYVLLYVASNWIDMKIPFGRAIARSWLHMQDIISRTYFDDGVLVENGCTTMRQIRERHSQQFPKGTPEIHESAPGKPHLQRENRQNWKYGLDIENVKEVEKDISRNKELMEKSFIPLYRYYTYLLMLMSVDTVDWICSIVKLSSPGDLPDLCIKYDHQDSHGGSVYSARLIVKYSEDRILPQILERYIKEMMDYWEQQQHEYREQQRHGLWEQHQDTLYELWNKLQEKIKDTQTPLLKGTGMSFEDIDKEFKKDKRVKFIGEDGMWSQRLDIEKNSKENKRMRLGWEQGFWSRTLAKHDHDLRSICRDFNKLRHELWLIAPVMAPKQQIPPEPQQATEPAIPESSSSDTSEEPDKEDSSGRSARPEKPPPPGAEWNGFWKPKMDYVKKLHAQSASRRKKYLRSLDTSIDRLPKDLDVDIRKIVLKSTQLMAQFLKDLVEICIMKDSDPKQVDFQDIRWKTRMHYPGSTPREIFRLAMEVEDKNGQLRVSYGSGSRYEQHHGKHFKPNAFDLTIEEYVICGYNLVLRPNIGRVAMIETMAYADAKKSGIDLPFNDRYAYKIWVYGCFAIYSYPLGVLITWGPDKDLSQNERPTRDRLVQLFNYRAPVMEP